MVDVVSAISETTGVAIFPNNGVTEFELLEYEPVPTALTAATRKTYAVPFERPVTVVEVAVEVPSANVVHELPLLLEY